MELKFKDIDILDIIPQRPPFVMIDNLKHCDMMKTVATFTVRADNLFCENGRLNACALMENIAQTCAARMGYIKQYVLKENVKLGFIGSVKNMKIAPIAIMAVVLSIPGTAVVTTAAEPASWAHVKKTIAMRITIPPRTLCTLPYLASRRSGSVICPKARRRRANHNAAIKEVRPVPAQFHQPAQPCT